MHGFSWEYQVHPHVCGEHSSSSRYSPSPAGSSPRVWGTPISRSSSRLSVRFIPTCVGNTVKAALTAGGMAVHPHVCGEHLPTVPLYRCHKGSSPRVWGTQSAPGCRRFQMRFIPTCVGNTDPSIVVRGGFMVHPHVCGEHWARASTGLAPAGSSPRVWGTPPAFTSLRSMDRFIPTCVGNTDLPLFFPFICQVHPHVCGEHYKLSRENGMWKGSSPRVWGTRDPH